MLHSIIERRKILRWSRNSVILYEARRAVWSPVVPERKAWLKYRPCTRFGNIKSLQYASTTLTSPSLTHLQIYQSSVASHVASVQYVTSYNSMRPLARLPSSLRSSGRPPVRCFASSTSLSRSQAQQRRTHPHLRGDLYLRSCSPQSSILIPFFHHYTYDQVSRNAFSSTSILKAISFRDLKSDSKPKETPDQTTKKTGEEASSEEDDPAERAYREAQKESEAVRQRNRRKQEQEQEQERNSEAKKEESTGGNGEEQKKRNEPPPPPPHGNKSPWQVFSETLSSEFKASKEWNESTKQLASSAHQFTENESVKRARAAYTAASGAATSGTASAIKGAGKAIGQGAAWTWDTAVVKGVRTGVNATASGIDKVTKPVRDTKVYKTAVGGVKDVIDDGSSSKYGGWVEKEERRKQRELRELNEAGPNGRPGRRGEKIEEDPK